MLGPGYRRTGDYRRDQAAGARRRWGTIGVCVFLSLVVVDFAWMWPIFTGGLESTDAWRAHMWLPSWV
jgi:dolichyl-phosphate-mannose--protein O-mannosyl transferase